jgi:hypothetical protein
MSQTWKRLSYRATESVATSATVQISLPDGRLHAQLDRHTTDDGRTRWTWRGGGLEGFTIEVAPRGDSFLLTDPVGIPFGRICSRGTLQPRLTGGDADAEQFVIDLDGRIRSCHGLHRGLGRIGVDSPAQLTVDLEVSTDETLATLLAAAPLCHVVAQVTPTCA